MKNATVSARVEQDVKTAAENIQFLLVWLFPKIL